MRKEKELEQVVRMALNEPVSLTFLNGKQIKILLELFPEPGGLPLNVLAERCQVRDLMTLNGDCQALKSKWGLLNSLIGAHGRLTWSLVGRLDLKKARLVWSAQPEAKLVKTRPGKSSAAQKGGKPKAGSPPALSGSGKTESWEDPAAQKRGKPKAEKKSWKNRLAQNLKIPKAGGAAGWSELGISESWKSKAAQNRKKSEAAGSLKSIKSLKSDSKEPLDSSLEVQGQERENRQLLKNAKILFVNPVNWHPSFAGKSRAEILGWLAQASQAHRQGRLTHPWGLAYKGLLGKLKQKLPDDNFQENPERYLPEEYLEACGLASYACPDCDLEFGRRSDLGKHQDECHPYEERDEPTEPERPGLLQDQLMVNAWQQTLDHLETQMSWGVFQTRVKHTWPVEWDETEGLLSLRAGSLETATWLENRLPAMAGKILSMVLNREVKVRMVLI